MGAHLRRGVMLAATVGMVGVVWSTGLLASHAWGNYHWARKSSSFRLVVVNSTTEAWDPYVSQAISDWSQSNVLDMVEDPNGSTVDRDRRQCTAPTGQVRICNLAYGQTGWLGIAGISLDQQGHIISGYTKLNDTYFTMAYYNKDTWKQSVTCQELGHDVGLGHQDEDFDNATLKSCMDYQDPPYEFPNGHDYEQLSTIYGHVDSYDSYSATGGGTCKGRKCAGAAVGVDDGNSRHGWGISLGRRGAQETFLRIDPDGTRHLTHVTWAIGHDGDEHGH